MNEGLKSLHSNEFQPGEVRFGARSPGTEWTRLDGSRITLRNGIYSSLAGTHQSTLPQTWTTQTSNFGGNVCQSVAYENGLWVVGGGLGTLVTSVDAINWVSRTSNFGTTNITEVAYLNGLWYAGGYNGTIRTSTDAITWNTQTTQFSATFSMSGFAYGNSRYIGTAYGVNGQVKVSTDGVTWATQPNFSPPLRTAAFGNGLFVIAGDSGILRTSTDGTTWTTRTSNFGTNSIYSVIYVNNQFIAAGTNQVNVSTDGITWTTLGSVTAIYVAYGNGMYVTASGFVLRTSTDGVTWTTQLPNTSNSVNQNLVDVAYGNNIFVTANASGDIRVLFPTLPTINLGNNIWGWIRE